MSQDKQAPEWLVPGADVVVFNRGGTTAPAHPKRTTVRTVAKQSFTVHDEDTRFRIDTQQARQGGTWGWTRLCVPAGSDEAHRVLDADRRARLVRAARAAVNTWGRSRTRENRLAAIAALQAVEDDEPGGA